MLEHNSAMENATNWIITLAISQPQTMPAVPAYLELIAVYIYINYPSEYANVAATDGNNPSTEKLTEKLLQMVNFLLKSCRYPNATRISSSASSL